MQALFPLLQHNGIRHAYQQQAFLFVGKQKNTVFQIFFLLKQMMHQHQNNRRAFHNSGFPLSKLPHLHHPASA